MDIFNDLCRSCNGNKEKLINMHDMVESSKLIKDMLGYCLQTKITNEPKYPKFMCYDCLKLLEISYRFIKRYRLSQREFDESYIRLQTLDRNKSNESHVEPQLHGEIKSFDVPKNVNETTNSAADIDLEPELENHKKQLGGNTPRVSEKYPSIKCSFCHKSFYTSKALNLHLKLTHEVKNL